MYQRVAEVHQGDTFGGIEAARRYAAEAEQWQFLYGGFRKKLRRLGIVGRYLEIGSGPGVMTAAIAQENPGVHITGVDLSRDMVSIAREYVQGKELDGRIRFVTGDAANAGLLRSLGRFDLIYSTLSMHHWENPRQVVRNLVNALAEGGAIVIYDLRRVCCLYWIRADEGLFDSIRAAYLPDEVREMLRELGVGRFEVRREFPFMLSAIIRG
jgi:SAM-dependent methyltransferase